MTRKGNKRKEGEKGHRGSSGPTTRQIDMRPTLVPVTQCAGGLQKNDGMTAIVVELHRVRSRYAPIRVAQDLGYEIEASCTTTANCFSATMSKAVSTAVP